VAEVLAQHKSLPLKIMGVRERFGQSGAPEELIREYGLDAESIASEALNLINAA